MELSKVETSTGLYPCVHRDNYETCGKVTGGLLRNTSTGNSLEWWAEEQKEAWVKARRWSLEETMSIRGNWDRSAKAKGQWLSGDDLCNRR